MTVPVIVLVTMFFYVCRAFKAPYEGMTAHIVTCTSELSHLRVLPDGSQEDSKVFEKSLTMDRTFSVLSMGLSCRTRCFISGCGKSHCLRRFA